MSKLNPSQAPVLDMAQVNEMKQVMEEEFDELMQLFLDDTQTRLDMIENAVVASDALGVRQAAHALKASSGNVGAARLAQWALLLEQQAEQQHAAALLSLLEELRTTVTQTEYAVDTLLQH